MMLPTRSLFWRTTMAFRTAYDRKPGIRSRNTANASPLMFMRLFPVSYNISTAVPAFLEVALVCIPPRRCFADGYERNRAQGSACCATRPGPPETVRPGLLRCLTANIHR